MTATLLLAAVSGALLGATGCNNSNQPDAQSPQATNAPMSSTVAMTGDKHACKGQNACKGQGGCKTA